jgi:crossover junction endodeoxyribonuclease RuvC
MNLPHLRLIGLDPGLRRTGWGVIAVDGSRLSFIACGVVNCTKA